MSLLDSCVFSTEQIKLIHSLLQIYMPFTASFKEVNCYKSDEMCLWGLNIFASVVYSSKYLFPLWFRI